MRSSVRLASGLTAALIAASALAGCGTAAGSAPASADVETATAPAVNPREHLGHRDLQSRDLPLNRREHVARRGLR